VLINSLFGVRAWSLPKTHSKDTCCRWSTSNPCSYDHPSRHGHNVCFYERVCGFSFLVLKVP